MRSQVKRRDRRSAVNARADEPRLHRDRAHQLAVRVLRDAEAEMRADPPIHAPDIVERAITDREAAQVQQPLPLLEGLDPKGEGLAQLGMIEQLAIDVGNGEAHRLGLVDEAEKQLHRAWSEADPRRLMIERIRRPSHFGKAGPAILAGERFGDFDHGDPLRLFTSRSPRFIDASTNAL